MSELAVSRVKPREQRKLLLMAEGFHRSSERRGARLLVSASVTVVCL